jgi:hypothetical protein
MSAYWLAGMAASFDAQRQSTPLIAARFNDLRSKLGLDATKQGL